MEEEDNCLKSLTQAKKFHCGYSLVPDCYQTFMALCNLTKVAKLCLVYFSVDKSTCIIETKKLRLKETGKLFSETAPNARDVITVKSGGKLLEAMVIATGGK